MIYKIKTRGPEKPLVLAIMALLRSREWYVIKTHGNEFQSGLPDLYATHSKFKSRWIEVKDPKRGGNIFTPAQMDTFPKLSSHGSPVFVLTGATEEDYQKLFKPENWYTYLSVLR